MSLKYMFFSSRRQLTYNYTYNNKPDIAIVGLKYLEDLRKRADLAEENDALDSVKLYLKEKKEGKLKVLKLIN